MVKVLPRTYTGEVDASHAAEDPGTWLAHFEMLCGTNGWADDAAKLCNFPPFLAGEAEDWYMVEQA